MKRKDSLKNSTFSAKTGKAVFGLLLIGALSFIFGPNIYAQFTRQDGPAGWGYGNGIGYGYGYGINDGSYRVTGGDPSLYTAGVGYGFLAVTSNGGGGGGTITTPCASVTYSDFGACTNGFIFRTITAKSPNGCAITTTQQIAQTETCGGTPPPSGETGVTGGTTTGPSSETSQVDAVTDLEKTLVTTINTSLVNRLRGRILLQVAEHGQAWYLNPLDGLKYYLGRPADALVIMSHFSLGMSNKTYQSFVAEDNEAPARLAGRILLNVDNKGAAYYVNPITLKLYSLSSPAQAFAVMRSLALGITDVNIRQIGVGEISE